MGDGKLPTEKLAKSRCYRSCQDFINKSKSCHYHFDGLRVNLRKRKTAVTS